MRKTRDKDNAGQETAEGLDKRQKPLFEERAWATIRRTDDRVQLPAGHWKKPSSWLQLADAAENGDAIVVGWKKWYSVKSITLLKDQVEGNRIVHCILKDGTCLYNCEQLKSYMIRG